jgi:hypothetical protein
MSLPAALQGFANYNQFIVYKLVPRGDTGKMDKLPVDWRNGRVADSQDPSIWIDYDTAYAYGKGLVGFVFTDHDPFWFLDIDDCLLPSGWSPLAQELCALLPGAAIEVSQSGKGLHAFGTGAVPKHACRGEAGLGLEFYHTGRFVALGNRQGIVGDCLTDCTVGVAKMVERYFNRLPTELPDVEWSEAPTSEWRGSVEDEELIRRACAAKSASGVFGSRATFAQLWDADVAALTKAFPDSNGRAYDASSADAALAQHLAFWTGKNCKRMDALMRRSKLYREKYGREDYLKRTILQAVQKQKDVCIDKPMAELSTVAAVTSPRDVEGNVFLNAEQQKVLFENCTYVSDINKILAPQGHSYKSEQFDNMFGGYTFILDKANSKTTRSAWEAFNKSQVLVNRKVHSSSFRPDKEPGEIWTQGNELHVNSYWPINTPRKYGNPRPFTDHVARILPNDKDRAIVLAYMAAVVQHRGVKFQWTPLVQGAPGNGKSLLSRVLVEAIGKRHCHMPNAQELTDKFNDWIDGKLFIAVEDVYVPKERREITEALKPMITNDWLEVQGKGKDKESRFVCANFMLNSNHKDAIQKTKDDRRFAVFYCAQQTASDILRDGMGGSYFPALYDWLRRDGYAIVNDYLMTYAIPDELNPAKGCQRAPLTSSTAEAIMEGMGTIEQEITAAVLEDRVGFRNGWISSHYLDLLINDKGASRIARNTRRNILMDLGYIVHPGLLNGQVNNVVHPDLCKPRLFIQKDHASIGLRGVAVAKAYEQAQEDKAPLMAVTM